MKIFVCYRDADRPLVAQLIADLGDDEHEVWHDRLPEGEVGWWDGVLEQIRNCDVLIFALTPASVDSYSCQVQVTYADALQRQIVPVLLAEGVSYRLLPVVLQERQIVNYAVRDLNAYKALTNTLRGLSSAPLPDPLPDAPPEPVSPLAEIKKQIDQPSLTYEQQLALIYRLRDLKDNPEYASDVRTLLARLSEHPALFARLLSEIEPLLPAQPESASLDFGLEAAETAPSVAPVPQINYDPENSVYKPTLDKPPILLQSGESIMYMALIAFHLNAIQWKDAKFTVTNQRMIFQFNSPTPELPTEVPLDQIASVRREMHGLVNPVVEIKLHTGVEYHFAIYGETPGTYGNREVLVNLIQSLISNK